MHSFIEQHKQFLMIVAVFTFGVLVGVVSIQIVSSATDEHVASIIHAPPTEGSLTNPVLDCEPYPSTQVPVYKKLEHTLEATIDNAIDKKNVDEISVYYRDMNSGAWVGINEKEDFSPASLLKVPILMAYLKEAERNPNLFTNNLRYNTGASNQAVGMKQNIEPTVALVSGQDYTVRDLLTAMIVDSDNDAQYALVMNMPPDALDQVYLDLGLEIPGIRSVEDFMSVNEYAGFFRILYNATYLNRDMSEVALTLLSDVEYDRGLRPGVPNDIPIAHKFGERGISRSGLPEQKQLHDCGIVYYPTRPYLLCVMTRGEDFEKQSSVIQEVSKLVYSKVHEFNTTQSSSNALDSD